VHDTSVRGADGTERPSRRRTRHLQSVGARAIDVVDQAAG